MDPYLTVSTGLKLARSIGQWADLFEAAVANFDEIGVSEGSGCWSIVDGENDAVDGTPIERNAVLGELIRNYQLEVARQPGSKGSSFINVRGEFDRLINEDTIWRGTGLQLRFRHVTSGRQLRTMGAMGSGWRLVVGPSADDPDPLGDLVSIRDHLIEHLEPTEVLVGSRPSSELGAALRERPGRTTLIVTYQLWLRDQPELLGLPGCVTQQRLSDGLLLQLVDEHGEPLVDTGPGGPASEVGGVLRLRRRGKIGSSLGLEKFVPPVKVAAWHRFDGVRDDGTLVSFMGQPSPLERRQELGLVGLVQQEARNQIRWSDGRPIEWLVSSDAAVAELTEYLSDQEFGPITCAFIAAKPLFSVR